MPAALLRLTGENPVREYNQYIEAFPNGPIPHAAELAQINSVLARYGYRIHYGWRKGDDRRDDVRDTYWDVRDIEPDGILGDGNPWPSGAWRTLVEAARCAYAVMLCNDGLDGTTATHRAWECPRREISKVFGFAP